MLKRLAFVLTLVMLAGVLAGCTGTPVIYQTNCTCPTPAPAPVATPEPAVETPAAEGALKTGLSIITNVKSSANAAADADGKIEYDATIVAVTVDEAGIIRDCIIDSMGTAVSFNTSGAVTTDVNAAVLTKNELGDAYGMKKASKAGFEWYEQAAALADYAVGKTVEELKNGAIGEDGKAKDVDLASTATIYLGGYVSAIEAAVNNAAHLGAQTGDELRMAVNPSVSGSVSATAEKGGTVQLDVDVIAVTMNGEIITSCVVDAAQSKLGFDAAGVITGDVSAPILTKNQLGEGYNMKAYAGSKYEWNEQAASFAAYVTGKTAADVAGIAVNEKTAPTDADLASTVTIAIGGFQNLIAKAVQ